MAKCPHFAICGGCTRQHETSGAQLAHKQRVLLDMLADSGLVRPEVVLSPLTGALWGYRRKARLSVKYVPRKGGALVGFREEKRGGFVADLSCCEVLEPWVGLRIQKLRELVTSLKARSRIPQIEVAAGDTTWALVFRNLDRLHETDKDRLRTFGREEGAHVYMQPGTDTTVQPLFPPGETPLCYRLPDFKLELDFAPTDFIQVNADINRSLVSRVVDLLQPRDGDAALDLFCGIGNFTLALARRGARVLGLEMSQALVERARRNAAKNQVGSVQFSTADLERTAEISAWMRRKWDKVCLDPPRTGALTFVQSLGAPYPDRIAYVSCNPETLARDAGVLVRRHGFRLGCAGIVDMFPHTDHIESLALFLRP